MMFEDVMVGKKDKDASDFVRLIEDKNTSILTDELLNSEVEAAEQLRQSLSENVKPVPSVLTVICIRSTCGIDNKSKES
ncbi:unnamed protein product [Didymodactylos carnosus]|uniref:Uncharacterized protein n=1 Tax=Didymodactylos carnosus TaxID=1234261 RepID=A0A814SDX2_9BILA|nr:unnamed protein product [Didymodactylos carnosus]CAF1521514.1 unnamed protein product [Didymodactylos carnosus]CAF3908333.1 unnamed protein product [Didymodactylos carnosus]CAF4308353.1 unnamed protein product [Didymodactylos carnosus]